MNDEITRLAKVAYNAYCKTVGWKAFNGDNLPQFEAVPERLQAAWIAAVTAVKEADR